MFLVFFGVSWWGHGHIVVSRIAEEMLNSKNRKLLHKYVTYGTLPAVDTSQAATWHDDLIAMSLRPMAQWHFSNTPFDDEGYTGPHNPITYNVTTALADFNKTILDPTTTDLWTLGFTFRSLLHFVGDIHTPHHNTARYTKDFPNGDFGGNLYYLSCPYGARCTCIHYLWDSAGGSLPISEPLLDIYQKEFKSNVSALKKLHTLGSLQNEEKLDLDSFTPISWSEESHNYGCNVGYATPMYGFPTEEYFKTVQEITKLRVVTAGYRLGNYLNEVFTRSGLPQFSTVPAREITIWVLDSILLIIGISVIILDYFKEKYTQV